MKTFSNLFKSVTKRKTKSLTDQDKAETETIISADASQDSPIRSDNSSSADDAAPTIKISTKAEQKTMERIHRLIQGVADTPSALGSILNKLQTGKVDSITNILTTGKGMDTLVFSDLKGKRFELGTAALFLYQTFGQEAMASGLLRNGILEELIALDSMKATEIIQAIFNHPYSQNIKSNFGLSEELLPSSKLGGIVGVFLGYIKSLEPNAIASLGNSLADSIENAQEITKLTEKFEDKKAKLIKAETQKNKKNIEKYTGKTDLLSAQISALEKTQLETRDKITATLLDTLKHEESVSTLLMPLIIGISSSLAGAVDKNDLSTKTLALEQLQTNIEQSQKDNLIKEHHISVFDQITYLARKGLQLKEAAKTEELAALALPAIEATLAHPEEIRNILAALDAYQEAPNQQLANLAIAAMSLLHHEDVLKACFDQDTIKKVNESMESNLPNLVNKVINIFTTENSIERIMGKEGLETILPKALDLPKVQTALGITQAESTQFKPLVPEAINYAKSILQKSLEHQESLKSIATALQAYNAADKEAKPALLPALIGSAVTLAKQPEILEAAFNPQMAVKALDLPKVQTALGITQAESAQFKPLVPDAINYAKSIVQKSLEHQESLKSIATALQAYNTADKEAKPALLPALIGSAVTLAKQPEILEAAFNPQMAAKALDLPKVQTALGLTQKEISQFKPLVPDAINYAKSIIQKSLEHPDDLKSIVTALQAYNEADISNKASKLIELVNTSSNLITKTDVINAISNKELLDKIIQEASKTPTLKKYVSQFKEDLQPLKDAIKEATPQLLKILNKTEKNEETKKLLIKAEALLHAPIDSKKIKNLASEAIELYSKNPNLLSSIQKELHASKDDIKKIVDNSLKSLKKDNLSLKLLKPLGINGEFVSEILEKITAKTNDPKSAKAINKYIDNPSNWNAFNIIYSTGNLSFVTSHIIKHGFEYLSNKTHKQDDKTPPEALLTNKTSEPQKWTTIIGNKSSSMAPMTRT